MTWRMAILVQSESGEYWLVGPGVLGEIRNEPIVDLHTASARMAAGPTRV